MTTETVTKCDWCGSRISHDARPLMLGFGRVQVDFCRLDCAILWCTRERDQPKVQLWPTAKPEGSWW